MFPKLTEDDLQNLTKDQLVAFVMAFSGAMTKLGDANREFFDRFTALALQAAHDRAVIMTLLAKDVLAAAGISTDQG